MDEFKLIEVAGRWAVAKLPSGEIQSVMKLCTQRSIRSMLTTGLWATHLCWSRLWGAKPSVRVSM